MPGWFQEEQKKPVAKEKEPEPITDYNELVSRFNDLISRIQVLTNESYNAIIPVVSDLFGSQGRNNPQDFGNVGKIRMQLQRQIGLLRTDTGRLMSITIKEIEDLNAWQTRYTQQMEECVDPLKFITESAFKIIESLYEQIETMDVRMKQMEGYIRMRSGQPVQQMPIQPQKRQINPMMPPQTQPYYQPQDIPLQTPTPSPEQTQPMAPMQPGYILQPSMPYGWVPQQYPPQYVQQLPPLTKREVDDFKEILKRRLNSYKEIYNQGDYHQTVLAKGRVFALCGRHIQKRQMAEEMFTEMSKELDEIYEKNKKITKDMQTHNPDSRNLASKDAILETENSEKGDEDDSGDMPD